MLTFETISVIVIISNWSLTRFVTKSHVKLVGKSSTTKEFIWIGFGQAGSDNVIILPGVILSEAQQFE